MVEVKCVVWDLDNTIWEGILLEDENIVIKDGIVEIIEELDSRGIIQSLSSKNDYSQAMEKLEYFNISKYFLYPEINWNNKSGSIKKIQENLNIAFESIMFIDDQNFERDEVNYHLPMIECVDSAKYNEILSHPRLNPKFITSDSKRRRLMYIEDIERKTAEENFTGPDEDFLKSLNMELVISEAKEVDLQRAEELTIRTNQMNATGITYSYDELKQFMQSDNYKLMICGLKDKYGDYGKIGLILLETSKTSWNIKLILISCRVISRGIGSIILSFLLEEVKKRGKKIFAEFKETSKNRMMYVLYKFANFKELPRKENDKFILSNDLSIIHKIPSYIQLKAV